MQGLRSLYGYQGRGAEWSRLVAEIVPDYCTDDDEPVPGREDGYTFVMEYRVYLAQYQERDLDRACALQEKHVAWDRKQAAAALALPEGTPLDGVQCNLIRTLGMSTGMLGLILFEQGSGDCVAAYKETVRHTQRIKDTSAEAVAHYNIGRAYHEIRDNIKLDDAEAAYQRALKLYAVGDELNQSMAINQIGMVHHERFNEARQHDEPQETLLKHAQAAEEHYQQSLALCPASAIADLGPMHNQLGILYAEVGQTDQAREHFEKTTQYHEQAGERYNAGQTRRNMALMYMEAAGREESPARQRDGLLRARAYAQAALRDFQHYQGRAAADEAKAQQLIDNIEQLLAQLPP
jgi:tetratricopeptide (TPR) repeat protein